MALKIAHVTQAINAPDDKAAPADVIQEPPIGFPRVSVVLWRDCFSADHDHRSDEVWRLTNNERAVNLHSVVETWRLSPCPVSLISSIDANGTAPTTFQE